MKTLKCLTVLFAVLALALPALAGNQRIIERRIQELDQVNRQAVSQLSELPQNGTIQLKARVLPEANGKVRLQIYDRKVLPPTGSTIAAVRPEAVVYTSFAKGFRAYLHQRQMISHYRDANLNGEFAPMIEGLRWRARHGL